MTTAAFSIRMITIDCRDPVRLAAFWSAVTDRPVVADHDGFVIVGTTPALGFQRVDEPTPGKNRIHVDGGGGRRADLVERIRTLGGEERESHAVPGLAWTVMADPEGNVFCIADPEK